MILPDAVAPLTATLAPTAAFRGQPVQSLDPGIDMARMVLADPAAATVIALGSDAAARVWQALHMALAAD